MVWCGFFATAILVVLDIIRMGASLGDHAVVSGGRYNHAYGGVSAVGGGYRNVAGERSVAAGGCLNKANGFGSAISGGHDNLASGKHSAVSGGRENKAKGDYSFASGFKANASDRHSAVLGFSGKYGCQSKGDKTVHVCATNGFFVNGRNLTEQIGILETRLGLANNRAVNSFTTEHWKLRVASLEQELEEVQAEKHEATNRMMSLAQDLELVQSEVVDLKEENLKVEKHMESQAQLIRVLQGQLQTQQVALQGVMLCSSKSDCSAADCGGSGFWWRTSAWILLLCVLHMVVLTLFLNGCMEADEVVTEPLFRGCRRKG